MNHLNKKLLCVALLLFSVSALAAPTITRVSPSCFTVGDTVRIDIYGTGLKGGRAYFNGIAMTTLLIDDTHVYVPNVHVDGLTTVQVRMQNRGWSNYDTFSTIAPIVLPDATVGVPINIQLTIDCPSWH